VSEVPTPEQKDAPPALDEKTIASVKEGIAALASFVALVYAVGYVTRVVALKQLKVGEISTSRETALLTGFLLCALLATGGAPYIALQGTQSKTRKEKILFTASLVVVTCLVLWGFLMSLVGPQEQAGRSVLSASLIFLGCGNALCWTIKDVVKGLKKDLKRGLTTAPMSGFSIFCILGLVGLGPLQWIGTSYGGLSGPEMTLKMSGATKAITGAYVCEDASWIVLRLHSDKNKNRILRIAKSEVKSIEEPEPLVVKVVPLKSKQ